jgi:hypothetical protein
MPVDTCAQFDDELVERYSLGRLTEQESVRFEEHFLLCGACQERLHASDEYVAAARAAGVAVIRRKPASAAAAGGSDFFRTVVTSAAALAAVVVMIGVLSVLQPWRRTPAIGETSRVTLETVRSGTGTGIRHTPVARRLILDIDTSHLPSSCECRLQIVNRNGQDLWERRVRVDGPAVSVEIPRVLGSGRYWVRLYGPESSDSLWREYGFEVD